MRRLFLTLSLLFIGLYAAFASAVRPVQPQCCFLDNPLGIEKPMLGWKLEGTGQGASQKAYEIQIASSLQKLRSGKADVWASGKVDSDTQFGIRPEVKDYASATTY